MKVVLEQQKEAIKKLYSTTDTEELAQMLGLKPRTVKDWAKRLNVKKAKGHIFHDIGKFTKELKKYIMENYSTMSNEDISVNIKADIEDILGYACAKGLKKRADLFNNINGAKQFFIDKRNNPSYNYQKFLGKEKEPMIKEESLYKSIHGKYRVNQNYFDAIDNEWKAYWLGFMYADGWNSVSNCYFGIGLSIKDKAHLIKFKKSLQADNKIYCRAVKDSIINGRVVKGNEMASLVITNKKLCENLEKLGCVQQKTYILSFPNSNQVPDYLMKHFIRGFLDGDGWVSTLAKDKTPSVGFVGMEGFIVSLKKYLIDKLNISDIKLSHKPNSATVEIDWCSFVDVEKLYNYLYNNANIFLYRKFKKLNDFYCLGQYEA